MPTLFSDGYFFMKKWIWIVTSAVKFLTITDQSPFLQTLVLHQEPPPWQFPMQSDHHYFFLFIMNKVIKSVSQSSKFETILDIGAPISSFLGVILRRASFTAHLMS